MERQSAQLDLSLIRAVGLVLIVERDWGTYVGDGNGCKITNYYTLKEERDGKEEGESGLDIKY